MQFTTIAFELMLLAASFSQVQAGPILVKKTPGAPIAGYTVGNMTFTGSIHDVPFQAIGTIQEIHAQFQDPHPEEVVAVNAASTSSITTRDQIFTRQDSGPPICYPVPGQDWTSAFTDMIKDGISYLDRIQGGCGLDGGQCSRVSCSYNSAIWFCNDNDFRVEPDCSELASYAQTINNDCNFTDGNCEGSCFVGGQVFDANHWNVIVQGDIC